MFGSEGLITKKKRYDSLRIRNHATVITNIILMTDLPINCRACPILRRS
jgi:hypothetical protein